MHYLTRKNRTPQGRYTSVSALRWRPETSFCPFCGSRNYPVFSYLYAQTSMYENVHTGLYMHSYNTRQGHVKWPQACYGVLQALTVTTATKIQAVEALEKFYKETVAEHFKVDTKRIHDWCQQKNSLVAIKKQRGSYKQKGPCKQKGMCKRRRLNGHCNHG